MSPILGRCGAVVAAVALTVTTVAAPALATDDPRPTSQGAHWAIGQLTNGLVHNDQYQFDDYGLSADVAIALDALGGHADTVTQVSNSLAQHVNSYTTGTDWSYPGDVYAGATAKSLLVAEVAGADPRSYGGVNLVSRLESMVSTSAPTTGRIEDQVDPSDAYGADYANTLGQALAARGLAMAASTDAPAVTDFLLEQQCDAGWFRLEFSDKDTADQACNDTTDTPDPDATAYAVIMLQPLSASNPAVSAALSRAEQWLLSQQKADGAFGGGAPQTAVNANSTGLAGWALGALGDTAAAQQAATWVRAHQAHDAGRCTTALASQTGAIAYDTSALKAGRTDGITTDEQDQWRRTSAQALPSLQWSPAADSALALRAPSGFVRAGSLMSLTAAGVAPGDTVCLTGRGLRVAHTGLTGTYQRLVKAPAGTAERTYVVRDSAGDHAAKTVRVLGRARFDVNLSRVRVQRGRVERVTVRGLFAQEPLRIRNGHDVVVRGSANDAGVFRARFHVGRRLGKATVRAAGRFGDIRFGRATYRVIR
jgi:hypothetical protein